MVMKGNCCISAGLVVEELEYYSENTEQGWVPLRILQPEAVLGQPRPVVVFLHATGTICIDHRYI